MMTVEQHLNGQFHTAYVALGSNIGDREGYIKNCLLSLKQRIDLKNFEISNIYQTTPVSLSPQPLFLNAVCRFDTTLTPQELLAELKVIEMLHGRKEKGMGSPRELDLDLLFYDAIYLNEGDLTVPHPRWQERLFVLIPLLDLTNEIIIPNPSAPEQLERIDLIALIKNFDNKNNESVAVYSN